MISQLDEPAIHLYGSDNKATLLDTRLTVTRKGLIRSISFNNNGTQSVGLITRVEPVYYPGTGRLANVTEYRRNSYPGTPGYPGYPGYGYEHAVPRIGNRGRLTMVKRRGSGRCDFWH
eukprot:3306731-Rhodomonas_salina.1